MDATTTITEAAILKGSAASMEAATITQADISTHLTISTGIVVNMTAVVNTEALTGKEIAMNTTLEVHPPTLAVVSAAALV
ncbi:hypothetical protein MMC29_001343 [Sticta canariensis]|nr:hypothetical protein [Sticta canariensis]